MGWKKNELMEFLRWLAEQRGYRTGDTPSSVSHLDFIRPFLYAYAQRACVGVILCRVFLLVFTQGLMMMSSYALCILSLYTHYFKRTFRRPSWCNQCSTDMGDMSTVM